MWPPTYIPYSSPFIGGLVIGPAAMFLRVAMDRRIVGDNGRSLPNVEVEMLKLCVAHIARFWRIGSMFLGKSEDVFLDVNILTSSRDC
jgi:hypothetical protein